VKPALKQLERAWKRVVFRVLAALLPGRRDHEPPRWGERPHRVLYLRYDRIGDMIMATPLIRAIASSHPTIQLDVLASPTNAVVLAGNPYVGNVWTLDRKRFASFLRIAPTLRRQRYDAVIDGMVLQPSVTMLLLMLFTGARHRLGIGGRANDFIYTLPVPAASPNAHQILQSAMTARPFGVSIVETGWRPEIFLSTAEVERALGVWRQTVACSSWHRPPNSRRPSVLRTRAALVPWYQGCATRWRSSSRRMSSSHPTRALRMPRRRSRNPRW
jgi:hypothetical protein